MCTPDITVVHGAEIGYRAEPFVEVIGELPAGAVGAEANPARPLLSRRQQDDCENRLNSSSS
jgi:hypothetical protein